MKNIKFKVYTIIFSILFTTQFIPINAASNESYSDEVFPEEKVKELINQASKKEVVLDDKQLQRSALGTYPTRKGIILVTDDAYKGVIKTGHSAIIYSSTQVIEANADGVEIGPNDWNISKDQAYAVTVKKSSVEEDSKITDWCKKQVGKPYNWNFYRMDYRDKFYCSHLIRAGYLDNLNIDLDTEEFNVGDTLKAIHPMELVTTDETNLVYRKK